MRKLVDDQHVPLPLVWSNFISLDKNKADLVTFLSDMIMTKGMALQQPNQLITGDGLSDATDAILTSRDNVMLRGNHDEADTRLILHYVRPSVNDMRECWSSIETLMYCCYWYTSCQQSQLTCGLYLEWLRVGNVTRYMKHHRDSHNL